MNSWFNSLIFYIKMYLVGEGQKFNPFSCSIFSKFQGPQNGPPKPVLLNSITWVIGSRFRRGIPLWIRGLILLYSTSKCILLARVKNFTHFHVRFFRNSKCPQNGNPKTALLYSTTWLIGSRFRRGIPLWIRGLILLYSTSKCILLARVKNLTHFHVQFFRNSKGLRMDLPNLYF